MQHEQPRRARAQPAGRTAVTFYLDADLRARARAAFDQTRCVESDASWSHMIGKAVSTEVGRRECLYNESRAFAADSTRLRSGRPVR